MIDRADWLEYLSKLSAAKGDSLLALSMQQSADILRAAQALEARRSRFSIAIFDFSLSPAPLIDSAQEVHDAFREGALDFIDESDRAAVTEAWSAIDHLTMLRMPTSGDLADRRERNFGGVAPRDYRSQRAEYAKQLDQLSMAYAGAGQPREAFRAAYRSDLAHFEAHLIDLATHSGDTEFLSVAVRLELAKQALSHIEPSSDIATYRGTIRNALNWATVTRDPIAWHS